MTLQNHRAINASPLSTEKSEGIAATLPKKRGRPLPIVDSDEKITWLKGEEASEEENKDNEVNSDDLENDKNENNDDD